MRIKRFEAKDMKTVLQLIKTELGPEAVILSARSIKKGHKILRSPKPTGVEVTAAIDTYDSSDLSKPLAYPDALADDISGRPTSGPKKKVFMQSVQRRIKPLNHRRQPSNSEDDRRVRNDDILAGIFQHLLSQGVKRDIANELIEEIRIDSHSSQVASKNQIISKIAAILKQKRGALHPPLRAKIHPKVMALIGPTGVGKTTTIAKLAAHLVIEQKKTVALISFDSYRIAATAELKVYGKAIGISVKTAVSPATFKSAIADLRHHDFILVDTPGFNPENRHEIDGLKSYFEALQSIEVHLLLSAGAKETDLRSVIDQLKQIPIQYLIFTKLDESRTYGNLVNLLVDNPLPLSFLTTGRQVPDTIEHGSLEKIAQRLVGGYMHHLELSNSAARNLSQPTSAQGRTGDNYVANKNSDVFHCPDCKWTKKIKPQNMIAFASVKAAQKQHFMPCRDCHPADGQAFQARFPRRDTLRTAIYP